MEFKEQNHLDDNGIDYLMHWKKFFNIRKSKVIMLSTSKYSMIVQYPILPFILMMFSELLIGN